MSRRVAKSICKTASNKNSGSVCIGSLGIMPYREYFFCCNASVAMIAKAIGIELIVVYCEAAAAVTSILSNENTVNLGNVIEHFSHSYTYSVIDIV
jgi:hypothetical protein